MFAASSKLMLEVSKVHQMIGKLCIGTTLQCRAPHFTHSVLLPWRALHSTGRVGRKILANSSWSYTSILMASQFHLSSLLATPKYVTINIIKTLQQCRNMANLLLLQWTEVNYMELCTVKLSQPAKSMNLPWCGALGLRQLFFKWNFL